MIQGFKGMYYRCSLDTCMTVMLFALPFYIFGLIRERPVVWLPAVAVIFISLLWKKVCGFRVGHNFLALPALPGQSRTICQKMQKRAKEMTCDELQKSLLLDSHQAICALPAGRYQVLTHDTVLNRLKREKTVVIQDKQPAYCETLQSILLNLTDKRCRHCRQKCDAWNTPKRQFYRVRFEKIPVPIGEGKEIL